MSLRQQSREEEHLSPSPSYYCGRYDATIAIAGKGIEEILARAPGGWHRGGGMCHAIVTPGLIQLVSVPILNDDLVLGALVSVMLCIRQSSCMQNTQASCRHQG